MGHNNGVITAPVNTDDVSAVLGANSHDVATLCSHERINKWSKCTSNHKLAQSYSFDSYSGSMV